MNILETVVAELIVAAVIGLVAALWKFRREAWSLLCDMTSSIIDALRQPPPPGSGTAVAGIAALAIVVALAALLGELFFATPLPHP